METVRERGREERDRRFTHHWERDDAEQSLVRLQQRFNHLPPVTK
jgi:hypothetical protein